MIINRIDKLFKQLIIIIGIIFVLNLTRIYFSNKISFKSLNNVKISWKKFQNLDNNIDLKPIHYYLSTIKYGLFVFNQEKKKEFENIEKDKTDKYNEMFFLEGIVFSDTGNSAAVLKDSSNARFYIKEKQVFKGWIVSDIKKKSIKLVSTKNKNVIKFLTVVE